MNGCVRRFCSAKVGVRGEYLRYRGNTTENYSGRFTAPKVRTAVLRRNFRKKFAKKIKQEKILIGGMN